MLEGNSYSGNVRRDGLSFLILSRFFLFFKTPFSFISFYFMVSFKRGHLLDEMRISRWHGSNLGHFRSPRAPKPPWGGPCASERNQSTAAKLRGAKNLESPPPTNQWLPEIKKAPRYPV